jgi:hypothetical protein
VFATWIDRVDAKLHGAKFWQDLNQISAAQIRSNMKPGCKEIPPPARVMPRQVSPLLQRTTEWVCTLSMPIGPSNTHSLPLAKFVYATTP